MLDRETPKKWYAIFRTARAVGEKEVSPLLQTVSLQVPTPSGFNVLPSLSDSISIFLDGEDEAIADIIEKLNIRFLPSIELKDAVSGSHLTSRVAFSIFMRREYPSES